jgi:hypothetical protein
MPLAGKLVIAGWSTLCAIFTCIALLESGKLLKVRHHLASWIEPASNAFDTPPDAPYQTSRLKAKKLYLAK